MSKRIPNKTQNFDGIDPQESLIKSLESIKSLLKQGDSKINAARENIAKADSLSSDTIENRLNEQGSDIKLEIPTTPLIDLDSIQELEISELIIDPELNENFEPDIEEIIVEALPENTIFNTNNLNSQNPKPAIDLDSSATKNEPTTTQITTQAQATEENTALNDLYDHNLIVPMLDEIVMPEEQNSSLFNMDSSVEIKVDSEMFELASDEQLVEIDTNNKLKNDVFIDDNANNSAYNTIEKTTNTNKTNADIISFELSSSTLKKNKLKKIEEQNAQSKKAALETELQNNISPIKDSPVEIKLNTTSNTKKGLSLEQVVIKETTNKKQQPQNNTLGLKEKLTKPLPNTKIDLSSAIDSTTYTDDILNNLSNSNKPIITKKSSSEDLNDNPEGKIDFTKIDGLDRLQFNADKMSALQKRVEKRVHNRLIQLIVQLDDEIKSIFTDEIKNSIAKELKDYNK